MQEVLDRASKIELVIFDVDGVLTDGRLYLSDTGQESKAFHSRDGHGMKMLGRSGVVMAAITGRSSNIVTLRMQELGIKHVFQGQQDKLPVYERLIAELDIDSTQVAYVGDDVVDLPVMRRVGLSIAVNDAHQLVKRYAHWLTPNNGGQGAARDVCELILRGRGELDEILDSYL